MPVAFIKKSVNGVSKWVQIKKMYLKRNGAWTALATAYVKRNGAWTKVFAGSGPSLNSSPVITPREGGKLFDTYDSTNGSWDGATSYTRQWSRSDNETGPFENITAATSTSYKTVSDDDDKWITVTVRASDGTNFNEAAAKAVKITKYKPVALTLPAISGTLAANSTVTALTTLGTYWKNTTDNTGDTAPDNFTYRWYWGDATGDDLGSSSTYTIQSTDVGHTLRVSVTATNTGGETTSTSNQTSTIGQPIGISDVVFEDSNGDSGFNNRGNLVTATTLKLKWKVSGVNSSTTFRVRYRVLNNQTGAYWNPDNQAVATASAAWIVYESDYNNVGNISNVTISGGNAFLYDVFSIPEIFNGSTYDGGISRWTWEYEISAVIGGTRYYWVPGDTVSTSFSFDWWDIDPTSLGTITATPTSGGPGTTVTFSGIIQSYPSGLNSYPYAYRVVYGDGSSSGWIYPSYGTNKPTYSLSNTYNSTGNYTAYVETIPDYSIGTASVSIQNVLTAPTVSFVSSGIEGAPVTAYFSGGSGPAYQIYWTTASSLSTTVQYTPDGSGSSSPVTDSTGPSSAGFTYYMYVRSVASTGETSVGPSSVASSWSAGFPFTVTSSAVSQNSAPTARATNTFSTSIVKYLDSITWSAGTYNNAASVTSVLLYSTNTSNLVSPSGNTLSSFRTANPYAIVPSDPAGVPYVFTVRDTVVGTNGTTYYYFGNQITSANADAVAFSYGSATSAAGGWTASINSGAQTEASYSYVSATAGSGSVNSSTGAVTASGLSSAQSSTITVNKSVSGYNTASTTVTGTASTVVTYTLTYSANGGSTTPLPQPGASGATITLASGAGTRSGFSFGGWNIGGSTYSGGGSYTFGSANATATAIWNAVFVTPSISLNNNPPYFFRSGSTFNWGWDNASWSGSTSGNPSYPWRIRSGSSSGTIIASGTRSYTTSFRNINGIPWNYRIGTTDGDTSTTTAGRWGSYQATILGTNGQTYSSGFSASV
jgi:hypothetical protein